MRKLAIVVIVVPLLLTGSAPPQAEQPLGALSADAYWPSTLCRDCHDRIFEQHAESMHAKSFTNPIFQAQYFDDVLLQTSGEPAIQREADMCIACHSPITYTTKKSGVVLEGDVDPVMSGVTCDFCHTVPSFKGEKPGNANYVAEPGDRKLGPFMHESDWHHVYSEFITTSEFCAVCHNYVNHLGLEIRSTYSEWKTSRYADEDIHCQDCHMNVDGFLTAGRPRYESGEAASMTLGNTPYRGTLYTHRFPGAHSRSQVVGALTLEVETDEASVSPGHEMSIEVTVDNSKTGHKMPSGSPELRLLWLEVRVHYGRRILSIPATPDKESEGCDVSGHRLCEGEDLNDEIPTGSRLYRAIYLDSTGKRTLSSYRAAKTKFDNRLDAGEIRKERYRFEIPEDAEGTLSLVAKLHYLSYPRSFAKSLGVPSVEPVEIAAANKELGIR